MEASLAAVGSHAEDILECIDGEVESGRPKPIDIEDLLANVIPSILAQSGKSSSFITILFSLHAPTRIPVPAGESIRLC